jgi:hypothetical protein
MHRLALILIMLIVALGSGYSPARAGQSLPDYSVAFGYKDGIRIATIAADGTLSTDFIPGAYFQQGDVALVKAVWSPDGRTLYYVVAPSDTPDQYRHVYAYDRATKAKKVVVFLKQATASYDYAVLDVSPDGRYLWLHRVVSATARLIDVQAADDKRVVMSLDECPATVAAWTADIVYVEGYYGCIGALKAITLATGKVLITHASEKIDPNLAYQRWTPIASTPTAVLVDVDKKIWRMSHDAAITSIPDGQHLRVSADGKIAAFWNAGKLYQVDMATGKPNPIVDATEPVGGFAAVDQVGYWVLANNTLRLITIDASGNDSKEFPIDATGATLESSPDSSAIALVYREQNKLLLYSAAGKTFDSTTLPADVQKTFKLPNPPEGNSTNWWQGWYIASNAINGTTGQMFTIPQPQTTFAGGSRDGAWWLFACIVEDETNSPCGKQDKLIAVNPQTGKTLTLSDDVALNQRNFHFPPRDYYAWSR